MKRAVTTTLATIFGLSLAMSPVAQAQTNRCGSTFAGTPSERYLVIPIVAINMPAQVRLDSDGSEGTQARCNAAKLLAGGVAQFNVDHHRFPSAVYGDSAATANLW